MRLLLQRVKKAQVTSPQEQAQIEQGILIFAGFHIQDNLLVVEKMIEKLFRIHYFSDESSQTRKKATSTIVEKQAEILIVSQFTLFADVKKGRTPSWHRAAPPELAKKLYLFFCQKTKDYYSKVKTGVFGAYMQVELINDGPFTLLLDSQELFPYIYK
jgi:D-tyrosyl-tRNA(Tyr) deacylase